MSSPNRRFRCWMAGAALASCLALSFLVWWRSGPSTREGPEAERTLASESVVRAFYKSLAALDVGENELAATVLEAATRSEPHEPALWANLAVASLRLNQVERATECIQEATRLAPRDPQVRWIQGELLANTGRVEEAVTVYRTLSESWPENVRLSYALATLLGQLPDEAAARQRLAVLSQLLSGHPGNLRLRCEQARLAAAVGREDLVRQRLDDFGNDAAAWPPAAVEQLQAAREAVSQSDLRDAARALTFFENTIKPLPRYQQGLAELGMDSSQPIATPVQQLLTLAEPPGEASPPDTELAFAIPDSPEVAARSQFTLALELAEERRSTLLSLDGEQLSVGGSAALPFPGTITATEESIVCGGDFNADFHMDLLLVGTRGLRLYLGQPGGGFQDRSQLLSAFTGGWKSAWAADLDADGDLDVMLSDHQSRLQMIRNGGDLTFTLESTLPAAGVRQLRTADLDGDGDLDVVTLDAAGDVQVWWNERETFGGQPLGLAAPGRAVAIGDVDQDGQFELLVWLRSGVVVAGDWAESGEWRGEELPGVATAEESTAERASWLGVADLDNNGTPDVVLSDLERAQIWLSAVGGRWLPVRDVPSMRVTSLADVNSDGLTDLVGLRDGSAAVGISRGQAGYGWHDLYLRANSGAGDRRINSFGIGGRVEVRAGLAAQTVAVTSPRVHVGLGRHAAADVARIRWPNGTTQAEFDLPDRGQVVAVQRLKGSCPWVFIGGRQGFEFLTDFIWRSPLGLRINAQDTAGVLQTEDRIKIPGERFVRGPQGYSIRITAELWETHFFDQIALLACDHPADVEMHLDERFVPGQPPRSSPIFAPPAQALVELRDHRGRALDEILARVDQRYAQGFALGPYQGVAETHWVEFSLPEAARTKDRPVLLGTGWIYPTDSSINVALAQGRATRPFSLTLDAQADDGSWKVLEEGLGIPAGKNKTVVIPLPHSAVEHAGRLRLRTNMEVYWDRLAWTHELTETPFRLQSAEVRRAVLRYRGYSRLLPTDRRRPDTPRYELAARGRRWLDLEGFYTRFGDVRELLAGVDDRYVIMNAGDELALDFVAAGEALEGWRRDFVLVGDGWVKDGDFNTAHSETVLPLPTHGPQDYGAPRVPRDQDPVLRRHRADWLQYHTRYVPRPRPERSFWEGARHPGK